MRFPTTRRSLAALAAASLAAAFLPACVTVPRTVTLSEADISRALDRRMPVQRRLLEVFDVTLSSPHVTLLPDTNRLGTEFDLGVGDRLGGRNWRTRLGLDYGLRYDESDQAIHLSQVRVRRLNVEVDAVSTGPTERLAAIAAEQLLEGVPIYRFKPQDLKTAQGLGVKPGAITVTPRGVEITLAPIQP